MFKKPATITGFIITFLFLMTVAPLCYADPTTSAKQLVNGPGANLNHDQGQSALATNVSLESQKVATVNEEVVDFSVRNQHQRGLLLGLMALLLVIAAVFLKKRKQITNN